MLEEDNTVCLNNHNDTCRTAAAALRCDVSWSTLLGYVCIVITKPPMGGPVLRKPGVMADKLLPARVA